MATAAQPEVLNQLPSGGLFRPDSHEYFDQNKVPILSVTQVLQSCGWYELDRVPFDVLEHKRQLGSAVHKACEFIDTPEKGELDWDYVDEEAVPYVVAYERFCKDYSFKATMVEYQDICTTKYGMKFGYQLDRVGTIEGGTQVIIDLKCAYDEGVSWPLQLAAYEMTLPPPKGQPTYVRLALQLKDDCEYFPHKYENIKDTNVWLWSLGIATEKINRGLKFQSR